MQIGHPVIPILADAESIWAAVVVLITIIGWIVNLVSNKNQKGPPVANRPRPPARPRDDRLQQEINIFVEEVGGRKPRPAPPRPAATAARQAPAGKPRPAAPVAKSPPRRSRPGEEIATRHAPVTESLGTGVKQHLSQHMTERVTQEVQQRLAPRVEEKVAQDLGTPVTTGPAPAAQPAGRAERLAAMLRQRPGMEQAIVMNLILSPPVSRTRVSRR